jgi:hypothetical protein
MITPYIVPNPRGPLPPRKNKGNNIITMRIHLSLMAAVALVGSVSAQSTTQYFGIDGFQTSFTSRGGISSGSGEILQGFHASHHRGVLENNGNNTNASCSITSLRLITQDQNNTSQETFNWVVRAGDDVNGPTLGTGAGLIATTANITTPPPGANPNRIVAWQLTSNLTTPINVGFCDKFLSIGTFLGTSSGWTMDGQSNHTSFSFGGGTPQRKHHNTWIDNGTSGIEHSWQILGTATAASNPGSGRSWRYWAGTNGAIMNLGCGTNGNRTPTPGGYGMGGMFPKTSNSASPLSFQARLNGGSGMSGAASVAVLSLIPSWQIPVLVVPFGSGARLYLPNLGATFFFFGPAANGAGVSVVPIAPFVPSLGNTSLATFPIQGALDTRATGIRLTNGQAVTPQ